MAEQSSFFKLLTAQYRKWLSIQLFAWVIAIIGVAAGWVKPLASQDLDRLLQVIAVLAGFAGVLVGAMLFRRQLERVKEKTIPAREKLETYRQAAGRQWLMILLASLVSLLSYFLVGNWAFAGLGLTLLAIYGALNPFKQKVMLQLRLTDADVAGL